MNVVSWDAVFVASLVLFIVLLVFGGAWTVVTVSNMLSMVFPILRNTIFGVDTVIAIASFFEITALNIYMRVLNKAITGKFYESAGAGEWIRNALGENRHIILKFTYISMALSTIINTVGYAMLRKGMLVSVFGVYQDAIISGLIIFAVFELWVVTIAIIFYDLFK
jgi:hypothetical protein